MEERPRNVAILGTGKIAEWHIKALRSIRGVKVASVCDVNLPRAREFAEKNRIPGVFGSLDDLLANGRPEVVHILLPAERHFEAARQVLQAGVHALVEKPICLRPEECDGLIALAESHEVRVAVSHNFLFAEVYESLKRDVEEGRLGRVDQVRAVWNKPLPQLTSGPYSGWMLRDPENIILEVGPHAVAAVLDLVGMPENLSVRATNPIVLPNSSTFYRRWRVEGYVGNTLAEVLFSFAPGFEEHSIHVRGSLAGGSVDFERNTYVRHQHVASGIDLDRYAMTACEAGRLRRQALKTLWDYACSKVTRSPKGSPFGWSIARSLESFYSTLGREQDRRGSAIMGKEVVTFCQQIGRLAALPKPEPRVGPACEARTERAAEVLVIGATGFIGRELVHQLADKGHTIRVLARDLQGWAKSFDPRRVEVVKGDASDARDLDAAVSGVTAVFHLARAAAKTWDDCLKNDVGLTRQVAEACLRHKVRRLIYTSSISAYYSGRQAGTITEQTPLDPNIHRRIPYARSKAVSEEMLLEMHRREGLPVVIVRPGVVLGVGGSPFHGAVGLWSGESICRFWGEGTNPLPIVLVEDVASAMISAWEVEGIDGESFNLVGEPCLSARDYIHEYEKYAKVRFDTAPKPIYKFYAAELGKWAVKVLVRHPERSFPSYRNWETRRQLALYDCSKARRVLGWAPTADRDHLIRRGIQEPAEHWMH